MSGPDRKRSPGYKMAYITRLVRARFDERARELGLTRAQWQAIATIHLREGATQREIAETLNVSSVTIGRIVERLEQDGWVERRPDAADRRAYRLYLQPGAIPILAQLGDIANDEESLTLAGISTSERALLEDLLDRIVHNLEQRDEVIPEAVMVAEGQNL